MKARNVEEISMGDIEKSKIATKVGSFGGWTFKLE